MGGRGSRQVISVESARQRLSPSEIYHAEAFFDTYYDRYRGALHAREFRDYLLESLQPLLPVQLANALFTALEVDRKGGWLSYDELLCGLCILQHGTPEERFRLVFHAFDGDRDAQVSQEDLRRFAEIAGAKVRVEEPLDAATFHGWAEAHRDTELVSWIFEHEGQVFTEGTQRARQRAEQARLLPDPGAREAQRQDLTRSLGLTREAAEHLWGAHTMLQSRGQFGVVDEDVMKSCLVSVPQTLRVPLLRCWDSAGSGTVSEAEFLTAAAVHTHGSAAKKLALLFRMFDTDGRGTLSAHNVAALRRAVEADSLFSRDADARYADVFEGAEGEDQPVLAANFEAWVADVVGTSTAVHFVDDLWMLLRVDLRLRPLNPLSAAQEERAAIVRFRGAEFSPQDPAAVGVDWYLVPARWWQLWQQYVEEEDDPAAAEMFASPPLRPADSVGRSSGGLYRCGGPPPPIDLAPLLDPVGGPRTDIDLERDVVVVPALCWRALVAWYGGVPGQLPLVRQVHKLDGEMKLELYPTRIKVAFRTQGSASAEGLVQRKMEVSASTTTSELIGKCREAFQVPEAAAVRLLVAADRYSTLSAYETAEISWVPLTEDDRATLEELEVANGQFLVFEKQPATPGTPEQALSPREGSFYRNNSAVSNTSAEPPSRAAEDCVLAPGQYVKSYCPIDGRQSNALHAGQLLNVWAKTVEIKFDLRSERAIVRRDWVQRVFTPSGINTFGRVGLQNMGNTCYMNSALQCLSHTRLLREYFTNSNLYLYDLNRSSTWGMSGKLAVVFSDLLQRLWFSDSPCQVPRHFRHTFGTFRPAFGDYRQQDAEEFLAHLLGGISEDLNLVEGPKPAFELADSGSRRDEEVADERWGAFCSRDNSVITSIFTGQQKVRSQCKDCGKVSREFDALLRLSISLAEYQHRFVAVVVVPEVGPAVRLTLAISKSAVVGDVAKETAALLADGSVPGVTPQADDLIPTARQEWSLLHRNACVRMYSLTVPLTSVPASDTSPGSGMVCYWVPGSGAGGKVLYVLSRQMVQKREQFMKPWRPQVFGKPILMHIPPDDPVVTGASLYEGVWAQVRRLVPDWTAPAEGWQYPFNLTTCDQLGRRCTQCSWVRGCFGCLIKPDECEVDVMHQDTLAIDWNHDAFTRFYKPAIRDQEIVHPSVGEADRRQRLEQRMSVEKCMDSFTGVETIEKHCSACAKAAAEPSGPCLTPHTLQLSLWRLPPVLVLHLKRFRHDGGRSEKLCNMVTFPLKGLDLSAWLAPEEYPDTEYELLLGKPGLYEAMDENEEWWDVTVLDKTAGGYKVKVHESRQDIIWRSIRREFIRKKRGQASHRDHPVYDLYAVVNHTGVCGSGHYYSYIKSGSGWYTFNDSTVVSMPESEVVTSDAYLLFYYRRERSGKPLRIHDVWKSRTSGKTPADPSEVRQAKWVPPRSRGQEMGCAVM
eukprot:TRINITY_DN3784_c1_g1_i1.p1 TRINITY_DN3784_c1_g1~~TRINITY_DN3784_c1_g1_i1.p1  ORF type:complete len:1442 (+),score=384.43 TRINITY_DN3784_c1_g1_i1:69-4394(+)